MENGYPCKRNPLVMLLAALPVIAYVPVDAMEPAMDRVCPQVRNERVSNLSEREFRARFADELRGQRLVTIPLGSGINLFRVDQAAPDQFVTRQTLLTRDDRQRQVLYSEPNYRVKIRSAPADGYDANDQYGLKKINAPDVWNKGFQGSDVTVVVVDSGVHVEHPDLKENLWRAPHAFTVTLDSTAPIYCAEGSIGFNAIEQSCAKETLNDALGHGTHVAGIIGASGAAYVSGVAPKVKLLIVKAFDDSGIGHIDSIVRGLNFVLQVASNDRLRSSVRVVNNSWGYAGLNADSSCFSAGLSSVTDALIAQGILVAAAASNEGFDRDAPGAAPYYLPSLPNDGVLSASLTGQYDSVGGDYGLCSIDIRAPGMYIRSTLPPPHLFGRRTGASMSTAFVSGSAALVLSACPTLTVLQLKSVLMNAVDPINQQNQPVRSAGRLNVEKAVADCSAPGFSPVPLQACP